MKLPKREQRKKINILSIVEYARPDFKKSRPKRLFMVLGSTISIFAAAVFMTAVVELFKRIRN